MAERIITGKTGEPHVTSLDERVLNGSLLGRNTLYKLPWGNTFNISITGDLTARVGTGIGVFQGIEFMVDSNGILSVSFDDGIPEEVNAMKIDYDS